MSGIIGHTLFGLLGLKAATHRKLPTAPIAGQHLPSYLAGAYLGCDIQTMPEAVCLDTGREVGYGTVPLDVSPLTGGPVRPWSLQLGERSYRPGEIHTLFYGRSHLAFGYPRSALDQVVPWDHLPDYFSATVEDTLDLFGAGHRQLAYLFGWMAHVISDSLIKSVYPGIELHLLDGKYTSRNRPVQDLVMFHEIGIKELHLDWPALLSDFVATPVEPIQYHYMRIAEPRGKLGRYFAHDWRADQRELLAAVLAENRRWCRFHAADVQADLALIPGASGALECNDRIRQLTGLTYSQMVSLAEEAKLRHACWQMGEAIADMFAAILPRSPRLAALPLDDSPTWETLSKRWKSN